MTGTAQRAAILAAMAERGWETVSSSDGEWWVDEFVILRSQCSPAGSQLVLTFLVDPQHDGPRQPGEEVWAVAASTQIPTDRASAERSGFLLTLGRGWQAHLDDFVRAVDALRR